MSEAKQVNMIPVVGVRFGHDCRISYCDPKELSLERGERVVVQTPQGEELGTVVAPPRWWPEDAVAGRLRPVLRLAEAADEKRDQEERAELQRARECAQEQILASRLPMRLVDVEKAADPGRITFYFVADGRVDFRELVHQLTERLHTRVELRQIGARDHARMLGGVGPCGRPLCCAAFLQDFAPVSIRMAKDQNLVLSPGRISGMCGRLMCCLRYEEDLIGGSSEPDGRTDEAATERTDGAQTSVPADEAAQDPAAFGCLHCPRQADEPASLPTPAAVEPQPRRPSHRTRRGAGRERGKPFRGKRPASSGRQPEGPNVA